MKIQTNNKIYIQKNDIANLNIDPSLEIPASIFLKLCNNGLALINDSNRYEFIEFNEPNEISFFKKISWIVDYNDIKNLSKEEIFELLNRLNLKRNSIVEQYNKMSNKEKQDNYNLVKTCELINYKIYSIRDILWLREGNLEFNLPDNIEINYIKTNYVHKILNKLKK